MGVLTQELPTDLWGLNGLCHVLDVLVSGYKTECWYLISLQSVCGLVSHCRTNVSQVLARQNSDVILAFFCSS